MAPYRGNATSPVRKIMGYLSDSPRLVKNMNLFYAHDEGWMMVYSFPSRQLLILISVIDSALTELGLLYRGVTGVLKFVFWGFVFSFYS